MHKVFRASSGAVSAPSLLFSRAIYTRTIDYREDTQPSDAAFHHFFLRQPILTIYIKLARIFLHVYIPVRIYIYFFFCRDKIGRTCDVNDS